MRFVLIAINFIRKAMKLDVNSPEFSFALNDAGDGDSDEEVQNDAQGSAHTHGKQLRSYTSVRCNLLLLYKYRS
jgi:hypothetical protein